MKSRSWIRSEQGESRLPGKNGRDCCQPNGTPRPQWLAPFARTAWGIARRNGRRKNDHGAAVIELLHAYPALIVCPPHLVPKWIREIEEVIPGAHARELRRIGRNANEMADVNDVRDFLEQYQAAARNCKGEGITDAQVGGGRGPYLGQVRGGLAAGGGDAQDRTPTDR